MPAGGFQREVPRWALVAAGIAVVAVLSLVFWQAFAGGNGAIGPSKTIHPGQYDLRAEIRKMRAAQQSQSQSSNPWLRNP